MKDDCIVVVLGNLVEYLSAFQIKTFFHKSSQVLDLVRNVLEQFCNKNSSDKFKAWQIFIRSRIQK